MLWEGLSGSVEPGDYKANTVLPNRALIKCSWTEIKLIAIMLSMLYVEKQGLEHDQLILLAYELTVYDPPFTHE